MNGNKIDLVIENPDNGKLVAIEFTNLEDKDLMPMGLVPFFLSLYGKFKAKNPQSEFVVISAGKLPSYAEKNFALSNIAHIHPNGRKGMDQLVAMLSSCYCA